LKLDINKICKENKIDLMIEDSIKISLDLIKNGIKVYTMNTRYNQKEQTLNRVSKWKEIYGRIVKLTKKEDNQKVNVILDTDIYNEIDDQFALAYILKSKDVNKLEAVTIAPFTKGEFNTENSIEKSYDVAKKIFEMCGEKDDSIIYKGATKYFKDNGNQTNEAVDKIIQIAKKNDLTYILSIGCITNVALAIKKDPSIINKIEIVWLGTNFLFMKNDDFNFRQDVEAIKFVLNSKALHFL